MRAKMSVPAVPFPVNDRDYYPLHEKDDVAETDFHRVQTTDVHVALRLHFPDRFVSGNICIYWIPGNTIFYRAPDVFVAEGFPAVAHPRVYHMWQDPPVQLAIEIGSRSTLRQDEGPQKDVYQQDIRAEAYLYANPPEDDLRLWRQGPRGYELAEPEPNGRLRYAELGLEFGIEEGFLRLYTVEGERLQTPEEAAGYAAALGRQYAEAQERTAAEIRRRQEAEARAQAAEEQAQSEAQQRREAEVRVRAAEEQAQTEAQQRREAEAKARAAEEQAQAESQQRRAAEARADDEARRWVEVERELAALRARFEGPRE